MRATKRSGSMRRNLGRMAALTGFLLAFSAGGASAGEFYYVMIFGSQGHPKQLRYTHTWATFVKAVGEGADPNAYALEANTISWLPETLDVKVWRLRPEPGTNLDLDQTLAAVYSRNEHVTMWGPFRVQKAIYERSLAVRGILDNDTAQYRAISGPGNLLISDCIHAVAAVDPLFGRGHYPLIRIGKPASRYIAREAARRTVFDPSATDNRWLIPRFGLDRYPIEVVSPAEIPRRPCGLCRRPE